MKTKIIELKQKYFITLNPKALTIFGIFLGSLLIAILAQISIYIPFSPVPITGQTIGILLIGSILGPKKGFLSVVIYLSEGLLGFPVFTKMNAGLPVLFGYTGGYLWSFLPAVYIIGYLSKKNFTNKAILNFISCLSVTLFILIFGTIYLSLFFGINKALTIGFYPFVIVGIIKSLISATIITIYKKLN